MKDFPYPKSFPNASETKLLILILCADEDFLENWHRWKEETVFDDIDFATLRLLPLIYLRMRRLRMHTDDLFGRIRGVYKTAWVKNQRLLAATKEIIAECNSNNVPILILKGIPLLLEIYKDMGARFLGDADFLIPPEHAPQIVRVLLEKGWQYDRPELPDAQNPVSSMYYVMKSTAFTNTHGIDLDVHWNIFSDGRFPKRDAFRHTCWKDAIPMQIQNLHCSRLSNEDMLIHVINHGAEENRHRTLRWVVDASAIINNVPVDWEKLLVRAKEFGFVVELQFGFRFLKEVIGENIPESFLKKLSSLPVHASELKRYYQRANIAVSERYNPLGNFPVLFRGYWKFEKKRWFPLNIWDFSTYLCRSWGLESPLGIVGFALIKYKNRFLKRNEAFPLLDMLRGGIFLSTGRGVAFLASFAVFTILASHVPRNVVGSYNFLIATLAIISITTLPGMNRALVRAIAKGYEGSVQQMMKKRLRFGILGSLISAITGVFFLLTEHRDLGYAFIIAAPFVPVTDTFNNFAINYWQGRKQFKKSAITTATYYVGIAIITIPFLLIFDSLPLIVLGVLSAQCIMGLIVYAHIHRKAQGPSDKSSESLGVHLTVMHALRTIASNIDKVIIWYSLGSSLTAVYALAAAPVSKASNLIPIGAVSLPHLSERGFTTSTKRIVIQHMILLMLISVPGTALVIYLAPWIYAFFFPLYPDSVIYFQILFTSMALSPGALLRTALTAGGRTSALYAGDVVVPVVKIMLMIALIIPFGILGLAVGVITSLFLEFFLTLIIFLKTKVDPA